MGDLGVLLFFGVSGFLITQSWLGEPRLWVYAAKRALRIVPALAIVLVVTAVVVAPIVTTLPTSAYFRSHEPWLYIGDNLLLDTDYFLPGVFTTNPYPLTVNGSLWTLPHEAHGYIVVALLGLCGILNRRILASIAFVLVVVAANHLETSS